MIFALSTSWFGAREITGEAMADTAAELGFDALELGYNLKAEQVAGIRSRVDSGLLSVKSVHAFCPVPAAAKAGHPELYRITDGDEEARCEAVKVILENLRFAADFGATAVVLHAGRILPVSKMWRGVFSRISAERTGGFIFRYLNGRMVKTRAKLISTAMDSVRRSLDTILPEAEKLGVRLALENLPSYDAVPQPDEMEALLSAYALSPALAAWFDIGHGQVMENAGFGNAAESARRLLPHLAGIHIHDVIGPSGDHHAPGTGGIDFAKLKFLSDPALIHTFEPGCGVVSSPELKKSLLYMRDLWGKGE